MASMKKMLTWILSAMILSTACMLSAQDAPQNFRNRRPQNRISPQERKKQWESVQKQLKQKYPEKYQEIMKLAESNFQEAQEKLVQTGENAAGAVVMDIMVAVGLEVVAKAERTGHETVERPAREVAAQDGYRLQGNAAL